MPNFCSFGMMTCRIVSRVEHRRALMRAPEEGDATAIRRALSGGRVLQIDATILNRECRSGWSPDFAPG